MLSFRSVLRTPPCFSFRWKRIKIALDFIFRARLNQEVDTIQNRKGIVLRSNTLRRLGCRGMGLDGGFFRYRIQRVLVSVFTMKEHAIFFTF